MRDNLVLNLTSGQTLALARLVAEAGVPVTPDEKGAVLAVQAAAERASTPWAQRRPEPTVDVRFNEDAPHATVIAPAGVCGDTSFHGPHDWATNPAAGSFRFRCPGRSA